MHLPVHVPPAHAHSQPLLLLCARRPLPLPPFQRAGRELASPEPLPRAGNRPGPHPHMYLNVPAGPGRWR